MDAKSAPKRSSCFRLRKSALLYLRFLLSSAVFAQWLLATPAIAGKHEHNMKVICGRVREVNSHGLSGLGYLQWFFATQTSVPASSVPGFWKELKGRCLGAW